MRPLETLARGVPQKRAEDFLQNLLNLRAGAPDADQKLFGPSVHAPEALDRLRSKFSDLLPSPLRFAIARGTPLIIDGEGTWETNALSRARQYLAEAWRAPTVLVREIALYRLIGVYLYTGEEPRTVDSKFVTYNQEYWAEIEASRVDAFLLVLHRALHVVDRMRYCPNPECPAPYFIAKRRSQKYCSEICALPAQREFKRRWWAEHGEARRRSRQRAKAQTAKTRRKRGK